MQSNVHHRALAQESLLQTTAERPQERDRGKWSIKKGAVAWQGFILARRYLLDILVIISCLCSALNSMAIKMLTGRIFTIEVAVFRQ